MNSNSIICPLSYTDASISSGCDSCFDSMQNQRCSKRKIIGSGCIAPDLKRITKDRNKTSTYIVEDHHDVVPCIYRLIGSKRIPLDHLTLLHLDSHSDLSIPQDLDADLTFSKEDLFSALSIESWIIPMIYGGHFNRVIWIKPFWSQQSVRSHSSFVVGKHLSSGKIRLSSPDDYFLSELAYAPEDQLTEGKPCELHVMTLGDASMCDCADRETIQGSTPCSAKKQFESAPQVTPLVVHTNAVHCDSSVVIPSGSDTIEESPLLPLTHGFNIDTSSQLLSQLPGLLEPSDSSRGFVLDIDLDFFSTANPFRSMLTDQQRHLLAKLYHYTPPLDSSDESLLNCIKHRNEQLSYLKAVLSAARGGKLVHLSDSPRDQLLLELFHSIKSLALCATDSSCSQTSDSIPVDPEFDYEWLHEIGTGTDDVELPHHLSSQVEICRLVEIVADLLRKLPRPAAITIARSSSDDYCPVDMVDYIQNAVLTMLQSVYHEDQLEIQLKYDIK